MKYVRFFTDLHKTLKPLSYTEKGRLLDAAFIYADTGEEPELTGNERYLWPTIKSDIDRQREAYQHQCEVNKANITNRYDSLRLVTNGNESKQEKTKEKKIKDKEKIKEINNTRFTPPTVEEVAAYCKERQNSVNPQRFCDFYASKNWMVGKNKMVNWKAAVRNWEDSKPHQGGEPKRSKYDVVKVN